MRKRLILLTLLVVVVLFTGVGGALAQSKNTLIVATGLDDVITLDPGRAYESTNLTVHHATYDTLLEIRADDLTKVVPSLAESYTLSDDGLVYTFKLRAGVKFASGNPLTADDVRFSWTRLKNLKGNPSFYADPVANVEAVDAATVKVTLSEKFPAFPTVVTAPAMSIIDSKLAKKHGATDAEDADKSDTAKDWLDQNSAGSGPFVLTGWKPNTEVTLVRNDNYWREKAALDGVTLRQVNDDTAALQLLERGDVDVAQSISADLAEQVKSNANLSLQIGQTLNLTYLAISPSKDFNLPLADVRVRKAIAQAVDYDAIIKDLLSGYADRPAAPLPIGVMGSDPAKRYNRNLDEAKKLMKDAGVENGFEMAFTIGSGSPGGIPSETLAAKLQADLAEIGVKLTIAQKPTSDFLTDYRAQKLPFVFATWTPDYLDPTMWSDYFSYADRGLSKRIKVDIPALADLATQAGNEADPAKRAELYGQYQAAQLEQAVFIPLFQEQSLDAVSKAVKGYTFHPVYFMDFYAMSK